MYSGYASSGNKKSVHINEPSAKYEGQDLAQHKNKNSCMRGNKLTQSRKLFGISHLFSSI